MTEEEIIVKILEDKTEVSEMVQGDVVTYLPEWEFKEVAGEIIKELHQAKLKEQEGECRQVKCWNCGVMVNKNTEELTTCGACGSEN